MRADWAEERPDTVAAVIRAVYRAGLWCANAANHRERPKSCLEATTSMQPGDRNARVVGTLMSVTASSGKYQTSSLPMLVLPTSLGEHAHCTIRRWCAWARQKHRAQVLP